MSPRLGQYVPAKSELRICVSGSHRVITYFERPKYHDKTSGDTLGDYVFSHGPSQAGAYCYTVPITISYAKPPARLEECCGPLSVPVGRVARRGGDVQVQIPARGRGSVGRQLLSA